ncbi:uncharacterized protein LOC107865744 [Capsicum annuum]|uniref:uncharacterized protein LOC107865744 n=1 Tax=Capsicum annuum TaxID=4072 RepID=UPI0007BF9A2F|nr:uncharacterized protein LOC107865744 [Capsicum annuum]
MSDANTSVATPPLNIFNGSDPSHPYYFHASDTPGIVLVNTPFTGRGFAGWRRSILISLSAKNKLGFIDGAYPAPSSTDVSFRLWNRCNDMVTSWLLNSLFKDIADSVFYSRRAKDFWTDLEHRFGQPNGAKLYHLQKKLTDLVQGSSDIAGYFTKIKKLWDELDTLNVDVVYNFVCTCNGKKKIMQVKEDER